MQNEQFQQLIIVCLIAGLVIIAMACLSKGILLEEGECWNVSNETQVCAVNCTAIDEEACLPFVENRTKELEDKCLSFANLSRQMNETFGQIGTGFLDDCNKWKNGSEKWQEAYDICDERLHQLNVNTIDELNESLLSCQQQYRDKQDKLTDVEDELEQAQSNFYTAPAVSFIVAVLICWFLWKRQRSSKTEVDEESTVPNELM